MIFEMKLAKSEKSSLDILYLTGSNKSGVLGVKSQGIDSIFTFTELRNRMICSIACEDHYSLLIAKLCTCIQNNFDFMNCLVNLLILLRKFMKKLGGKSRMQWGNCDSGLGGKHFGSNRPEFGDILC